MNQIKTVLNRLFSKYLLVTNTLTCGGLLAIGDVVTQKIERLDIDEGSLRKKKHNWPRTGRMFCMGFVLGPFNHCWYKILDHILKGATGKIVVKKIMCDQAVAAPFFCSSFFMGMSIMEGKGISGGVAEVKEKFLTVYMIDWCVWPPAQFINFYLLPTKFRVVYVATITFFWNTFLSWMKHRSLAIFCACTALFASDLFGNHIVGFPTSGLIFLCFQEHQHEEHVHPKIEHSQLKQES